MDHHIGKFTADFFVLRTPLFPVGKLADLFSATSGPAGQKAAEQALMDIFTDPIAAEGLYLASPVLYEQLQKMIAGQLDERSKERVTISLFQYFSRMTSRCTPFGLFAGFNTGRVSDKTELTISPSPSIKRHLRLDMDYVCGYCAGMVKRDKRYFSYTGNSSRYLIGRKMRYIETLLQDGGRQYSIASVETNELLEALLDSAASEKTYAGLLDTLTGYGLPADVAIGYLDQLIDAQLLVNVISANVTGDEFADVLLTQMRQNPALASDAQFFTDVKRQLDRINKGESDIGNIHTLLDQLATYPNLINDGKVFQMDMRKHALTCEISEQVIGDIHDCLYVNATLSRKKKKTNIDRFFDEFQTRFETASVKLTQALDAEIGIDYHNIQNQAGAQGDDQFSFAGNPTTAFKFSKLNEAIKSQAKIIKLEEKEMERFKTTQDLPNSLSAMVKLYKRGTPDAGLTPYLMEFRSANGPSGANLIGRFCHSDEDLTAHTRDLLKKEEALDPGKVFAEIAHISQSRIGNILSRPHLRQYEIEFLARSVMGEEERILLDDLYLKVEDGRLILFSSKLNKEVIPRLSSAHNYHSRSLQIYKFLCDLQDQSNLRSLGWDWDILFDQPYLPRVVYKGKILSLATWNIAPPKLDFFKLEERVAMEAMPGFIASEGLPRYVSLAEGDNEIVMDLTHPLSFPILKKSWKSGKTIRLKEHLAAEYEPFCTDTNGGRYANELVVPLTRADRPPSAIAEVKKTYAIKRNYPIGSEWLYFKIYTGVKTADDLLIHALYPFAKDQMKKELIDKWFFIRYSDPKFHLRVRLRTTNAMHIGHLLQRLYKVLNPYLDSGEVLDFQMATYKRELERYGAKTMPELETLFFLNSELVAKLLTQFSVTPADQHQRAILLLYMVDRHLDEFGLDIAQKLNYYGKVRGQFAQEFDLARSSSMRANIQTGYRNSKADIENILQRPFVLRGAGDQLALMKVIDRYFQDARPIIKQLCRSFAKQIKADDLSFLSSFLHMFVNRYFLTNNRFHEFVTYEYLERLYLSVAARQKKTK